MNNKYAVLIVEDDKGIVELLSAMLESENYQVISAKNYESGQMMFFSHRPDIVILDLGLPDKDGTEMIRRIRTESTRPIIVLSARSDEEQKIRALDLGANDYVTKPFSPGELLARIRSAIRSSRYSAGERENPGHQLQVNHLMIDYDTRQVRYHDQEIRLTQNEYNVIAFLSEHLDKIMTYSAIIKEIWGEYDEGSIKKLQVNMANIRKKFGMKPGEDNFIINELGVGYRMCSYEYEKDN